MSKELLEILARFDSEQDCEAILNFRLGIFLCRRGLHTYTLDPLLLDL